MEYVTFRMPRGGALALASALRLGGNVSDYAADLRKRAGDSWRDNGERMSADRDLRDLDMAIDTIIQGGK